MKKPELQPNETTPVVKPVTLKGYIGEASQEQIDAWKDANKIDKLLQIKVKNADKSTSVCYLKSADRNVASLAYTHIANKKMIEAGGVFIANCWLGGDERIKTDDRLYIAACQQAYDALDLAEATSEKI